MPAKRLLILCSALALLGAGCWGQAPPTPQGTAEEEAQKIQFIAGDTFEVRQTLFGIGGFLPDLLKSRDGVREVTITRFAPANFGALSWKAEVERETAASKQAREAYEAQLEADPPGIGEETPTPPKIETEHVSVSGTVTNINLKEGHSAAFPAYWHEGEFNLANERSGIWLSDDAFNELVRTRRTILNFGVFDQAANQAAKNVAELRQALATLRNQADTEGEFKDITLLEADPDFIEYTLKVNGEDRRVSAIRARNWFGEIIVLNNRQNPMILSLKINPLFAGAEGASGSELGALATMFGYEVTNIKLNRP